MGGGIGAEVKISDTTTITIYCIGLYPVGVAVGEWLCWQCCVPQRGIKHQWRFSRDASKDAGGASRHS
jgi:hypothetical protein